MSLESPALLEDPVVMDFDFQTIGSKSSHICAFWNFSQPSVWFILVINSVIALLSTVLVVVDGSVTGLQHSVFLPPTTKRQSSAQVLTSQALLY